MKMSVLGKMKGLLLFGLICVGIGIFLVLRKIKLKKVCTAQVDGTVKDCTKTVNYRRKRRSTYNSYVTTFTYSIEGVEYVQTIREKHDVGQQFTVYYDPSDPNRHYLDASMTWELGFLAISAVFSIALIIELSSRGWF